MNIYAKRLDTDVINAGLCIGCGACVSLDSSYESNLIYRDDGDLIANFSDNSNIPEAAWLACPGKGVDYPKLFNTMYGALPNDWRLGHILGIWTGYSSNANLRSKSSSGGVTTAVLSYLLDKKYIDAAVVACQGTHETPLRTGWRLVSDSDELHLYSQSVYVGVPMLSCLNKLDVNKKYAITVTPEDCSALRELQCQGIEAALTIKYVLGPYTGTTLSAAALPGMFKFYNVSPKDTPLSVKWRAGLWPGYFEANFKSGKKIKAKKVYYNFLIPFYLSKVSLTSMDFANDFTDLSVGDAWSPKFEGKSEGHSVVVCRSSKMHLILSSMINENLLIMEEVEPLEASNMHGHMIDFKRRGAYLRRIFLKMLGKKVPDNGFYPVNLTLARILTELIIFLIFLICNTQVMRWLISFIPPLVLGKIFDKTRLYWKEFSKPIKRKGLLNLEMKVADPSWKKND